MHRLIEYMLGTLWSGYEGLGEGPSGPGLVNMIHREGSVGPEVEEGYFPKQI